MKTIYDPGIANLPTETLPPVRGRISAKKKRKFVPLVGKVLLLGAFVGLVIYGICSVWSGSMSTSKAQPETFTELYFEDYLHLPSEVVSGQPYSFRFTLHNLEGKDMGYTYEVYLEVGQTKVIFDGGDVFVKNNGYKSIQERFATASIFPKAAVVVDLVNKHQQIDFLIQGQKQVDQ